MKYSAHIAADGREQAVSEHLRGTAELAARFASRFGAGDAAYFAGALHDAGKCTSGFQRRLHGGPPVDHSTAGACEAFKRGDPLAALAIAGHHGGIPDFGRLGSDGPDEPTLAGRMKHGAGFDAAGLDGLTLPEKVPAPDCLSHGFVRADFYTRMLFSCLVDADFQDTQNFMDGAPAPRGGYASIPELLRTMRERAEKYLSSQTPDAVSTCRCDVLRACLGRGQDSAAGLFTLTVPTGGGKTFSSLAFALEHAAAHGMDRVIYVIPYTSIIDQTVSVFSELLGERNVLAHYLGADYQLVEREDMTAQQYRRLLASENWDAPVIVTTAVQFFESVYSNRSSRCRKLHNIANSVVIFDEAQTLPVDFLMPCLSAIAQLVRSYRVTAVLCTATQPVFGPLLQRLDPELKTREICPGTQELYAALRRTVLSGIGCLTTDALAARLAESRQVLCVVNRRSTAQELFSALPPEGSYCLTTLLCAHDRRRQLEEIRLRLARGLDCRVVSTSLIEAGVDVDFPSAYREDCGLDSLLQTAGRCNREGKRTPDESIVCRFSLDGEKPVPTLSPCISAMSFAARRCADLASPEAISAYFSELLTLRDESALDKKGILAAIKNGISGCALPFAQISERFRLIDSPERAVFIPVGEGAALCARLRAGECGKTLLRRLGAYSVGCREGQFDSLYDAGALELLPDGSAILTDMTKYGEKTGLALSADSGVGFII